jgi:hypothetical protein
MNAAARVRTTVQPGRVLDFIQPRLENALRQRKRYRYVQPQVLHEQGHYRIQSPCCSRNVDKQGGLIDIALLVPPGIAAPADATLPAAVDAQTVTSPPEPTELWQLYARDHKTATWTLHQCSTQLQTLLNLLCLDAQRLFWP